jgi:MFS family permease
VLILGSGLSLVDNLYIISLGRLLYGVAIGIFSVCCPAFMNDLAPTELKGPLASITNIQMGLGMLAPFLFGLAIPEQKILDEDSLYVQEYWRVVWAFPMFMALL